jgi:hydroxyacylglutathione hydrolase
MTSRLAACLALMILAPVPVWAELAAGSVDAHWDAGAKQCLAASVPMPIQVHRYNEQTFILRENLCATWEAPFMYLLIGSKQALLIDTGDVADAALKPLAITIMDLLPGSAGSKMPLTVVHSHGHLDHRAGDMQFEHAPGVQVVPSDLEHVRQHFGFEAWPGAAAEIDLGERTIDVLPAPGHHPAQLVYYDRNTGLVFSGDYLLPGRLLVDDLNAYAASARRVADFLKSRPVSYVLGGHVEKNRAGDLFPWQATYHPDERELQLPLADVLALPAALQKFNGFYTKAGGFVLENPIHNLIAAAIVGLLILALLGFLLFRYVRRRRRARIGVLA